MPLTIPPFTQYQAPLYPLRGLWNKAPSEGDMFVTAEIDWQTLGVGRCVQFELSGNSPVAFSQIVAIAVDNSRSGSSVQFIFADSGFVLEVPADNQGVYPVFTNALTFYVNGPAVQSGDITVFQVLNSMPPPVPIQPSVIQQHAAGYGLALNATGSLVLLSGSGTLTGFSLQVALVASGASAGTVSLALQDSTATDLWFGSFTVPASGTSNTPVSMTGLAMRFVGNLSLVVTATSGLAASSLATISLYYTQP